MKNYRNVYRVLSIKNAINVLFEIQEGCKVEEYREFDYLCKFFNLDKFTMRRITNNLSSCGLIESRKNPNITDKRKRCYVVTDMELCDKIKELTSSIMDG